MTNPPSVPPPVPPAMLPPRPAMRPPLPKAPRATLSMVLGIVAVAGGVVLVVPAFVAPLAWYFGAVARRAVEAEPLRWSGAGEARAGLVLGMIGTGLLVIVLAVLGMIAGGLVLVSRYDVGYGA